MCFSLQILLVFVLCLFPTEERKYAPLSFLVWLTSFNMVSSIVFIYLQTTWFHFPLWLNKIHIYLSIYLSSINIYHVFLFHSSVLGHLGCFHSLTVVNSATINISMQVSLLYLTLLYIFLEVMLLNNMAVLLSVFEVFLYCFP
jgi:hypothetical protein